MPPTRNRNRPIGTATLWQEVARKDILAQQAKITLVSITANQPKTGWSIPSDWDLPKGSLVPITPTGMQPINPNEPNTPDITLIIVGMVTATVGVLVDKLSSPYNSLLRFPAMKIKTSRTAELKQ